MNMGTGQVSIICRVEEPKNISRRPVCPKAPMTMARALRVLVWARRIGRLVEARYGDSEVDPGHVAVTICVRRITRIQVANVTGGNKSIGPTTDRRNRQ